MFLSQKQYILGILKKFGMEQCRGATVPMQPNTQLEKSESIDPSIPYRELIGALLFLARVTRPDICYAVSKLAQFNHCYTQDHWMAAKGVLRYLSTTVDMGLIYPTKNNLILTVYSDSDYAGDHNDRRSTSGFASFLGDSLISWCAQKQDVVSLSSTEAEYIALCFGAREGVWLRTFAHELGLPQDTTPLVPSDSLKIRNFTSVLNTSMSSTTM